MREIGPCGAVAVPEVVVEEVGAAELGFVAEVDAGAVEGVLRRGGRGGVVRDEHFLERPVGEVGWLVGCGVVV